MKSRDFVFWLQGYFELKDASECGGGLSERQAEVIKQHLHLVFQHDPEVASLSHPEPKHEDGFNEMVLKTVRRMNSKGILIC